MPRGRGGGLTNVQQAAADKAAEQRTYELKHPPKPAEATKPLGQASSAEIVDKTPGIVNTPPSPTPNAGINVLNSFRSYSYKFTFAALDKSILNTPTLDVFQKSSQNLIILKSGGKGSRVMTATASTDDTGQKMIDSFNGLNNGIPGSPGRFDMYMDNVEIETIMSFKKETGPTLPTKISFEVFEPYSINGFIESLQVAAVAAGYLSYTQASFILKMEFVGYPDTDVEHGMPPPVVEIPGTVRYFVLGLTGVEVELTERGTHYKCGAVPYNELGFANLDNKLNQTIQIEGASVGDILKNFMVELSQQRDKAAAESKQTVKGADTYAIVFPSWVDGKGFDETIPNRTLIESSFAVNLKDKKIFSFGNLSDTDKPNAYKIDSRVIAASTSSTATSFFARLSPTSDSVVSFSAGSNIDECIAAVIVDSDYTRNLLKNIASLIDAYGMVDYFLIKLEITNQQIINDQSKMPYRNFKYVVTPYKVHYTSLSMYTDQKFDVDKYKYQAVRVYNYLYTGKNVDLVSFKLNFNTLFYEAIGNALGNNDRVPAATAGSNDDGVQPATVTKNTTIDQQSSVPVAGQRVDSALTEKSNLEKPTAGQQQDDPYWVMSRAMHNAIIDSRTSLITGEVDLIGDPFYLATGGIGNYNPTSLALNQNDDGSVNRDYGQVLILINFRNPVDIQPVDNTGEGGLTIFIPQQVSFSGIYQVLTVVSTFKDGAFKQRLSVLRKPQTDATGVVSQNPITSPALTNTPDSSAQVSADTNKTAQDYSIFTGSSPVSTDYSAFTGATPTIGSTIASASAAVSNAASPLTKIMRA
jgi:hypothetical protein